MNITIEQLKKHIESFGLVIDIRELEECAESGVIPTAEIIPFPQISKAFEMNDDDFENEYDFAKPTKEESIVVYCKSGDRSRSAMNTLTKLGFKVSNYVGSFDEWERLQNDVEFFE